MKEFKQLAIWIIVVLLLMSIANAQAQDATPDPTQEVITLTPEGTVVSEVPPVIVVETPSEESGPTWFKPEHIIMLILGIGLAFSHPPQTGKLFGDIMTRAQEQAAKTPTMLDDVIVEAVNKAVKPRLEALDAALAAVTNPPPDGTAVG